MPKMEKVVSASCILMSLLGYSISWHLIKAWFVHAVNYPSPQCWNSTCKREKRLSPLCTAWMEAGGENWNLEAPTSWQGEVICRAWTSFIRREAGGRWPPGVPHLNQTLKQPLALRGYSGTSRDHRQSGWAPGWWCCGSPGMGPGRTAFANHALDRK